MCIFLYLYMYFEIKRLPRYPHLSPLQLGIDPPLSSFLLYWAFLAKEWNLMHRNILLRVRYLLQRAATYLLRIFKGTFFTIEKDTTKRHLRGIRVHGERRLMRMVEQNGSKFRRLEKIIKKIAFGRNQKFFSGNVIVDSDEKIGKIRHGHFKSRKRARKITSRGSRV